MSEGNTISNSHQHMEHVDVLIIGAGPTGLMLALELAAQRRLCNDISGPTFLIVDRATTPVLESRALVLQSRSLELLERHDYSSAPTATAASGDTTNLASALSASGQNGVAFSVFVEGKQTGSIDLQDLGYRDTRWPLPLWISQADIEAELARALEVGYGVRVERGWEAWGGKRGHSEGGNGSGGEAEEVGIVQDGEGVTVTLRKVVTPGDAPVGSTVTEDGDAGREQRRVVRAKYVVGCDGAHSAVRHAAGLRFDGAPYLQDFTLCDCRVDWTLPHDRMHMFLGGPDFWGKRKGKGSLLAVIPLAGGVTRFIASRGAKGNELGEPTLEDFQGLVDDLVPAAKVGVEETGSDGVTVRKVRLHDPVWISRFRLHHRGVESYQKGRLLLAGDAAHIHSPAGGQGMNTGIQDAVNLGWKLAAVLRSSSSPSSSSEPNAPTAADRLLDSYTRERRPVGQYLLRQTDRAFEINSSSHWLVVWLRNAFFRWVFPIFTAKRERRAIAFGFISQLRIRYRHSDVVATGTQFGKSGAKAVRGGYRAPDGELVGPHGEETHVLGLTRPVCHHLLLFVGGSVGAETEAAVGDLVQSVSRVFEESAQKVVAHIICSGPEPLKGAGFADVHGTTHRLYGFDGKPGYVLVRPDGHVAHIGYLDDGPECVEWLKGYVFR